MKDERTDFRQLADNALTAAAGGAITDGGYGSSAPGI